MKKKEKTHPAGLSPHKKTFGRYYSMPTALTSVCPQPLLSLRLDTSYKNPVTTTH